MKEQIDYVVIRDRLFAPVCSCNSDTFVCDKCGLRMILKIYGDTTPCRDENCNGTMRRV